MNSSTSKTYRAQANSDYPEVGTAKIVIIYKINSSYAIAVLHVASRIVGHMLYNAWRGPDGWYDWTSVG